VVDAPSLPFAKMHGCGNDYVVVDAFHHEVGDPAALARAVCARRTGVGSDGLLLAMPGTDVSLRMRMFNVDGSEAEMCGNGLRCLVKFALERGLVPWVDEGEVETGAGVLAWTAHAVAGEDGRPHVEEVTIRMGRPELERARIPMRGPPGRVVDESLDLGDASLVVTAVSMGNPHAVTWVDDVGAVELPAIGPRVEHHVAFPNRTNTEFVEVVSRGEVRQRTWERGCGETEACGTGACAVAVAGVLTGRTDRELLIHLRGGDLHVTWEEEAQGGQVRMRGPATQVFEGAWPLGWA
jgi:diaminopimelate epimerase